MNLFGNLLKKLQWLTQEGFIEQAINCGFTSKDINEGIRVLSSPSVDAGSPSTEENHKEDEH